MHDDYDLRQEQLNKASLLSSKKFLENLLEKFISNVVRARQLLSSTFKTTSFPSVSDFASSSLSLSAGPWDWSLGHQLAAGLHDLCPLRSLQRDHRRAAV